MIGNSKSLLSLRFRHPNLVTLIGWGKHYELPSLSQGVLTIWVKPSNIAICCNRTEASLFGLWAHDWGRHLWSFAEKSKASEPSSLPLARWPKRIEGYRIYQNIKYQRTSMKIWRWTHVFWDKMSPDVPLPTLSFFLPKNGKNPSRYERLSALLDAASGLSHMHNSKPEAFHRVGNLRFYQIGNLPCWWMTSWFQASQDIKSANILLDRSRALVLWDVFSMKIRWFMFHDGLGTFQQSFFLFCPTGMVPQRWQTSVSASPLKPEMPKVARLVVSPIL